MTFPLGGERSIQLSYQGEKCGVAVLRNRECMAQHPASQATRFVDNRAIVLALECRDEYHYLAFRASSDASAAKEAALVPNYGLALQNKLHTA